VPEDERLLPCGTSFVVKTLSSLASDLLMVSLKQSDSVLLQGPGTWAAQVRRLIFQDQNRSSD
jgi:hypothetical protein